MKYYKLQARDSVTGAMYYWTGEEISDVWYPGPNDATELAILGENGVNGDTSVAGYAVLGKADTGAGQAHSIAAPTNSALIRGSGDLGFVAIEENKIVGRVTGGNVDDQLPNDFIFIQDTTVTKAGYWASDVFEDVISESSATLNVDLGTAPLGNGSYRFSVNIVATHELGSTYDFDFTFRAKRTSGTLAGAGLAAPTADPANDAIPADLSISFTDNSGALRTTVDNETGAQWSFTISVALIYVPYPPNSGGL